MLGNSVYSILSPEGYASILWKDSKRAVEAAKIMRMTAVRYLVRKSPREDIKDLEICSNRYKIA